MQLIFLNKHWKSLLPKLVLLLVLVVSYFSSFCQPNVVKIEYYIDADPGFGNGVNVPFTPGKDIQNAVITFDPTPIPEGVHHLFVRALDADGNWSMTNGSIMFYKTYSTPAGPSSPAPKPRLKKMEYFIDTDPGYGNGVPVALDSLTDFSNYIVPINATGLATGDHTFWLRALDMNGSWSLMNSLTFNVPATLASPSIVTNSITKTLRCARDSFDISYDITGTYNAGNQFNVELSDASGNFGSPTIIGTHTGTDNAIIRVYLPSHLGDGNYKVRVSSTSPVVTGVTNETVITIHDRPAAQSITGAINVNSTFSYNYSVPSYTGSTWKWIASAATITQTDNTGSLVWNTQGQPQKLQIVETSQNGCVGDTSVLLVNVYDLKIDNVSSSSLTPCPAGSITIDGKATGVYDGGNIFTAQLSDAAGSFANPVNIGTVSASPVGLSQDVSINATLPFPLANGTGYRVRIVSNTPSVTGSDNGQHITVSKPDLGADQSVTVSCINGTVDLTTLYDLTGLTPTYSTGTPAAAPAGDYTLYVANGNGCKDTAAITVLPARIETVPSTGGISIGINRECTDADGWTHYYNDNGTPTDFSDDIRILTIKKNGNDIGTVGLGGGNQFMASVVSVSGAGNNQAINVQSPLVGAGNKFYSMYRYWDINAAKEPATPVNIRFYFHTSDMNDINGSLTSGVTPDKLTAYHLPDGNADPSSNWNGATSAEFYQNSANPSINTWVYTDLGNGIGQAEFLVNHLSGGGLGYYLMGPVPVTIISFSAQALKDRVNLQWSTATESNSKDFTIQRSLDGSSFENIGTVAAAGNSNTRRDYSFSELQINEVAGRTVFYRIRENDLDGKFMYSEVRKVVIPESANSFSLLYNPVRNEAVCSYKALERKQVTIRVIDLMGRVVLTRLQVVEAGINKILVQTNHLSAGMYEVELSAKNERHTVKMVKE
ncbi:MAG: T9SS type A sorting domain-containing protein [Chitinophagaceae bacterium]|nr:T9SS type A sorting domain-containing protein [Chitinophagaceae bacterium]